MFKSIQFFRITQDWKGDLQKVESALDAARFVECGASQESSSGWVEPRGEKHGPLVESIGGHWIMKIMTESKILPGSVVREVLQERVEQIEASTGRKPGKKETKDLREDVHRELLSKAFTKKSASFVWIDPKAGLLIMEAGAKAKSDEIVTMLVKALEGFGVTMVNTQMTPSSCMSRWLVSQECPPSFSADRDCVLKAADESRSTVKYAKHALDIEEVREHIAQGKLPTQLAMTWNGRVSFMLTDAGMVKKVEFLDVVFDEGGEGDSGFDADAAIVTGEISALIPDLIDALGGEMEVGESSRAATDEEMTPEAYDALYEQAVEVVRANNKPSISLVQRTLQIGYNRAARLLERMESEGVVSPMDASGARTVREGVAA
jgi:recombination associated protein RdgC